MAEMTATEIPAFSVGERDDGESSSIDVEDALNIEGRDPLVEIVSVAV